MDRQKYLDEINNVISRGRFKDDWESLNGYQVPEWYRNAKFGIFIHWGVYSVPAFANEWYPRNMYIQGTPEFEHHRKTYGEHKDFGYKDFIPLFKAEKFNPDEWADVFKEAVPLRHTGSGASRRFQMYRSELSRFNAYEMGPKRHT